MVDFVTNKKLRILGLFRSGYSRSMHIREMASELKVSHVTLLPHLRDLEEQRVLNSKTFGRNKTYSLNLENIIARDFMTMAEKFASMDYFGKVILIKKLAERIRDLDLSTVILFGSYANLTFAKNSDIDLLVFGSPSDSKKKLLRDFGTSFGKKINIKAVSDFSGELRKNNVLLLEVVKNHIILQCPEAFVNALVQYGLSSMVQKPF